MRHILISNMSIKFSNNIDFSSIYMKLLHIGHLLETS